MKLRLLPLFLTAVALGCGDGAANFGATPGGTQDMQNARKLVENGRVPPASAFIVEGMFSEHDLPIDANAQCGELLCLGAAAAVAPNGAGDPSTWVQLGLSSSIDPTTFQRGSLAAVFVIDESGSMSYDYPGSSTPGSIAKSIAHAIVTQLDENDYVSIVTFESSAHLRMGWRNATDSRVRDRIDALDALGSTNMEAGLDLGIDLAADSEKPLTDETRIFLITDAQPNTGSTSNSGFSGQVATAAGGGIGITVLGTGLGLSIDLVDLMAQSRGGNAFSLFDMEEVPVWMENNWPWMMSPIAYDLTLDPVKTDANTITNAYGFPGTEPEQVKTDVATVFLSKNRGALLLELSGPVSGCGADISLSYEDLNGDIQTSAVSAHYNDEPLNEDGEYYSGDGVHKTVALALLVSGMKDAAEQYGTDRDTAINLLTATLNRFQADSLALNDAALTTESEFWPQLLTLMEEGAEQGTYYPD